MTMVANRQLKRQLLPVLKECAAAYERVLLGKHMILSCDDGLTMDVLWGKENFLHLCGLKCNRPQSMFKTGGQRPGEAVFFFDRLMRGKLSPDSLVVPDRRIVERKMRVLPLLTQLDALNLEVVHPRKSGICLGVGDSQFIVGFAETEEPSVWADGMVMFPRSLRAQNVRALAEQNTPIHTVSSIVMRDDD